MTKIQKFLIALISVYALLLLTNLWFAIFSSAIFFKITISFLVIFLLFLSISFIKNHFLEEEKMKNDNYIN
jgi:hypothetical protein